MPQCPAQRDKHEALQFPLENARGLIQKMIQSLFQLLKRFFQTKHQWGHFLPVQVKGIGVAEHMTEAQVFIQRVVKFFRQ
jgi:hypothetical protein